VKFYPYGVLKGIRRITFEAFCPLRCVLKRIDAMSDGNIKPLNVSTGDARKLLRVGATKLKELVESGKLKAKLADRRYRITMASIEAYDASLPDYVPGSALDLAPLNPVKRKTKRARRGGCSYQRGKCVKKNGRTSRPL
jgi:hypothetical protein